MKYFILYFETSLWSRGIVYFVCLVGRNHHDILIIQFFLVNWIYAIITSTVLKSATGILLIAYKPLQFYIPLKYDIGYVRRFWAHVLRMYTNMSLYSQKCHSLFLSYTIGPPVASSSSPSSVIVLLLHFVASIIKLIFKGVTYVRMGNT